MTLKKNGDLRTALDRAESDWATCAAQVDMIVDHQEKVKTDEKAR